MSHGDGVSPVHVHSPARALWAAADSLSPSATHSHSSLQQQHRQRLGDEGDVRGSPAWPGSTSGHRHESTYQAQLAALMERHGALAFPQQRGTELPYRPALEAAARPSPQPQQTPSQHIAPHRAALSMAAGGAYDDFVVLMAARQPGWYKVLQSAPPLSPVVGPSTVVHMAVPALDAPSTSHAGGSTSLMSQPSSRGPRTAAPSKRGGRKAALGEDSDDGGPDTPPEIAGVSEGVPTLTVGAVAVPAQLPAVRVLQDQGSAAQAGRPGSAPTSLKARIEGPRRMQAQGVQPLAQVLQAQRRAWDAQLERGVATQQAASSGLVNLTESQQGGGGQPAWPQAGVEEGGAAVPERAGSPSLAHQSGSPQPVLPLGRELSLGCTNAGEGGRAGQLSRVTSVELRPQASEGAQAVWAASKSEHGLGANGGGCQEADVAACPTNTLIVAGSAAAGGGADEPAPDGNPRSRGTPDAGALEDEGRASSGAVPIQPRRPQLSASPAARPQAAVVSSPTAHSHGQHGRAREQRRTTGGTEAHASPRPSQQHQEVPDPVSMLLASLELDKLAASIVAEPGSLMVGGEQAGGAGAPQLNARATTPDRPSHASVGDGLMQLPTQVASKRGLGQLARRPALAQRHSVQPAVQQPLELLVHSEPLGAVQRTPRGHTSSSGSLVNVSGGLALLQSPLSAPLSQADADEQVPLVLHEQETVWHRDASRNEHEVLLGTAGAHRHDYPGSQQGGEVQLLYCCLEDGASGAIDNTMIARGRPAGGAFQDGLVVQLGGEVEEEGEVEGEEEGWDELDAGDTIPDPSAHVAVEEGAVHHSSHTIPHTLLRLSQMVPAPKPLPPPSGRTSAALGLMAPVTSLDRGALGRGMNAPGLPSDTRTRSRQQAAAAMAAAASAAAATAAEVLRRNSPNPNMLRRELGGSTGSSGAMMMVMMGLAERATSPRHPSGINTQGNPMLLSAGSFDRASAPTIVKGVLRPIPSVTRRTSVTARPAPQLLARSTSMLPPLSTPQPPPPVGALRALQRNSSDMPTVRPGPDWWNQH